MRTIKFRGKSLATGKWVYGDLQTSRRDGKCIIYRYNKDIDRYWSDVVDPATVGQFTGLFDKDGNEIYEGDIVHIAVRRERAFDSVVTCNEGAFEVEFYKGLKASLHGYSDSEYYSIEVIGNAPENPELINQK